LGYSSVVEHLPRCLRPWVPSPAPKTIKNIVMIRRYPPIQTFTHTHTDTHTHPSSSHIHRHRIIVTLARWKGTFRGKNSKHKGTRSLPDDSCLPQS
jgi:hypothetical protein